MLFGIRWGSLRAKIIAWSFVPTAIILGAVALVTYSAYQQVTEQLVIERNRELTRLSASQLTAALGEYINLLDSEVRRSDIYRNNPKVQSEALMQARNRLAIFDGGVLLLDTFGTVVATEPERPEILDLDWSDRSYYRQVLQSAILGIPSAALSDIVADGPDGANTLAVAVPITSPSGEFNGILVGLFRVGATSVSALYGDIVRLRVGESAGAYLVDGNGRLIYHSDPARIGDDISDQEIVQQVLDGQTDAVRARDFEGRDIVASFAPIPGTSWGLVTQESWNELMRAGQPYRRFLLLLLALGLVVPAIVVAFGIRRITGPIADLTRATREVAGGKFGQTIAAETGDEIEELADQFNRMSAELKESYTSLEQRVAVRTRELAALNDIATVVSQSLDLDEILDGALGMTLHVMGIETGGIYLLDERAEMLSLVAQEGFSPEFIAEVDRLKVGEGFSGRVVQSGQPLVVQDVSTDPRLTRMVVQKEGLRSLVVVPLSAKGRVLGTLFIITHGYREFAEQDVELLISIGRQIGVAVDSARLFQAEQRRAEQFRVIAEVGRRITSILSVEEMLVEMAGLIQQAFNYYHVGIGLIEGDEVISMAEVGGATDAYRGQRLAVAKDGLWGWVAQSGQPLLVPDVTSEPRFQIDPRAIEIRSAVCVPLKTKEAVIGILGAESDQRDAFDESDLVVLQSLAHQAAFSIENARFFRDTKRQVRELRALADASQVISSVLDRDQLLQALYEQIKLIAPTDFYLITLYDEATNVVSVEICVDEGVQYPREQYLLDRGLLKLIIHEHETLRFDSLTEERHKLDVEIVPSGSPKISHGWLGVPMLYGEKVVGAIVVGSYRRGVFDEGHEQTLTSIANQAAVALENARLYQQAQQFAVMEERQRLARELHDAVTQTLFSASLLAEALPELWESNQDEGRQLLQELRQLSRGALAEMRTLLLELRPAALIEASLVDLLRQLGEAATGRTGTPVQVTVESQYELPPDVHVTFYRIAQEALNNVVKHARACHVEVQVRETLSSTVDGDEQPVEVELRVSDDGCGFDPSSIPSDRLGLGIIRERAQTIGAELVVESQPGHGTQITVIWRAPPPSLGVEQGSLATGEA